MYYVILVALIGAAAAALVRMSARDRREQRQIDALGRQVDKMHGKVRGYNGMAVTDGEEV
jgi:hypothetical protein